MLADTAATLADRIAQGPFTGTMADVIGRNTDGDEQTQLDLVADKAFASALSEAPVAVIGSEESDQPIRLDSRQPLAVAIDPLDGSSNIDTNCPVGTIFSILPMIGTDTSHPELAFRQKGRRQLAAGFFIFGPQTALVFSLGDGVHVAALDRQRETFIVTRSHVKILPDRREFAINASNYRFWPEPVRAYIDDCMAGDEGPRGEDFNMRWIASLVAESYRIFARGGVFLYPGDSRPGYQNGRLRLVYEANPIAFLAEQAGGAATDGQTPILDLQPQSLHQRVPLVFGSRDKVERIARYHLEQPYAANKSPLFAQRGLFRD